MRPVSHHTTNVELRIEHYFFRSVLHEYFDATYRFLVVFAERFDFFDVFGRDLGAVTAVFFAKRPDS